VYIGKALLRVNDYANFGILASPISYGDFENKETINFSRRYIWRLIYWLN